MFEGVFREYCTYNEDLFEGRRQRQLQLTCPLNISAIVAAVLEDLAKKIDYVGESEAIHLGQLHNDLRMRTVKG